MDAVASCLLSQDIYVRLVSRQDVLTGDYLGTFFLLMSWLLKQEQRELKRMAWSRSMERIDLLRSKDVIPLGFRRS